MVKKQNNVNWLTWVLAVIAIVALVLAIVAINKANMTGQGIFNWRGKSNNQQTAASSGSGGGTPAQINAHACSRDDTCEMNGARIGSVNPVQNTLLHIEDSAVEVKSILKNNLGNAWLMLLSGNMSNPFISFQAGNNHWWSVGVDGSDSESFKISKSSGLGLNDKFEIDTAGTIKIDSLKSYNTTYSNASYVCVNTQGELYRSDFGCY